MGRLACVDVGALPLQVLLKRRPDWVEQAVAVVDEARPQGVVEWVNQTAYEAGVLPGQRYAAALNLCPGLCAEEVALEEERHAIERFTERLRRFSPVVEVGERGTFWLDASGLSGLFGSASAWARSIAEDFASVGFIATVVVGFTRFGTFAIARNSRGILPLRTPQQEREVCGQVPLARLDLPPRMRDRLAKLKVLTVADFERLPSAGLRRRFGDAAHYLHQRIHDTLYAPLQPAPPMRPPGGRLLVEPPESRADGLLFRLKRLLDALVRTLGAQRQGVAQMFIRFVLDRHAPIDLALKPADATLDAKLLLELLRLRLETLTLRSGVTELGLWAQAVPVDDEQLSLLPQLPRRDQAAAERALARIRAELGDDAVGHFELRDEHLPEACFNFAPIEKLPHPQPCEAPPRLVRRLQRPTRFRPQAEAELHGPFPVEQQWWAKPIERTYYFHETEGQIAWVYFDRRKNQWFQQACV